MVGGVQVRLAFSATGLENKDRFSKSDPFLRVLKLREGGDWVPVLKTEVRPPLALHPMLPYLLLLLCLAIPSFLPLRWRCCCWGPSTGRHLPTLEYVKSPSCVVVSSLVLDTPPSRSRKMCLPCLHRWSTTTSTPLGGQSWWTFGSCAMPMRTGPSSWRWGHAQHAASTVSKCSAVCCSLALGPLAFASCKQNPSACFGGWALDLGICSSSMVCPALPGLAGSRC